MKEFIQISKQTFIRADKIHLIEFDQAADGKRLAFVRTKKDSHPVVGVYAETLWESLSHKEFHETL